MRCILVAPQSTEKPSSMSQSPHVAAQEETLAALMIRIERRARRLTGNPDAARDLAQETALRLWQTQQSGTEIEDATAYAMTILRHLAATRWRQGRDWEGLDDDMLVTTPDAPARIAVAGLLAAIERLPEDQARLMRLVAQGETSPAALARVTGLPQGTVMSRLARARTRLRTEFRLPPGGAVAALI